MPKDFSSELCKYLTYNPPEAKKLVDAFSVTLDEAKAKDLARQIQYRLLDQAMSSSPRGILTILLPSPT